MPSENRFRGTALALLIVPAGVGVWVMLWTIHLLAGVVGLGVALGALGLYRLGSGGRISLHGAGRVTAITIGTLVLAVVAGVAADGVCPTGPRLTGDTVIDMVLLVVFTALGVFVVFRTAQVQRMRLSRPGNDG